MLFSEKKSALVRLSDCIKLGISNCLNTTNDLINLHVKYEEPLEKSRVIARDILAGRISWDKGNKELLETYKNIPEEYARMAISLQYQLYSECLSTILCCCFALESYINSLAFYLLQKDDFHVLFKEGYKEKVEILIDNREKINTLLKWESIGKLKNGKGFDRSKRPFQHLKILFKYRNDIVHDKVTDYSEDIEKNGTTKNCPTLYLDF